MQNIVSTIEIALLIMFPLIIFYQQNKVDRKHYFITIPVLYLIWYLTYMLLHELTHWLGAWICGKQVTEYQLIPYFWKGNFGSGFIKYDFRGDKKDFFIIVLPYIRDIIFLITGYLIFKWRVIKNIFWQGFILVMFLLSPLYDITNNYLAYLFGSLNDFNALKISSNGIISNTIGLLFIILALFITYKTLWLNRTSNLQTKAS